MTILQAIILAVVEGITEFLPISSTGHMILTSHLLGIVQSEFLKSFEIIIQFGAILAVVALYIKKVWRNKNLWKPVILAFIPTGVLGVILYKVIKQYLLGNDLVVVGALLVGGIALLALEKWFVKRTNEGIVEELSNGKSLGVGVVQAFSMIPGVSRSAASIFGGMGMGLSRLEAVEFSFLLAVPTMVAATGLDLFKAGWSFTGQEFQLLLIGLVVSFIVALLVVRWFVGFVQTQNLSGFGWYRIVVAIAYLLLVK
jgi:undecaprenyl-diphosphatase